MMQDFNYLFKAVENNIQMLTNLTDSEIDHIFINRNRIIPKSCYSQGVLYQQVCCEEFEANCFLKTGLILCPCSFVLKFSSDFTKMQSNSK